MGCQRGSSLSTAGSTWSSAVSVFGPMLPGRTMASSRELRCCVSTLLCCDKVCSPSGEGR